MQYNGTSRHNSFGCHKVPKSWCYYLPGFDLTYCWKREVTSCSSSYSHCFLWNISISRIISYPFHFWSGDLCKRLAAAASKQRTRNICWKCCLLILEEDASPSQESLIICSSWLHLQSLAHHCCYPLPRHRKNYQVYLLPYHSVFSSLLE